MTDFPPPEAIQWHEGMLLAPQHFQQLSLRQEALLRFHLGLAAPFHWGIRRLTIDSSLLVDGTFRVNELEAIMPDALLVAHQGGDAQLEIDLADHMDEIATRPMTVHLVVPALKSDSPGKGELPRYDSVEGPLVADANTGEEELRIPRLRPKLGLLIGDKPPDKYVSFPLAEIAYRNEALVLSDFVAPCLWVDTDAPLGKACATLAKRVRERAVFLLERLRSPSATSGAPMVTETQGLVRALVAALPPFEAVIGTGVSHPYAVYLALSSLIGHLAAVGGGFVPPALSPYNHNDLRGTFNRALDFALRMIDSIREAYVGVAFVRDEGRFHLRLEKAWIGEQLVIGARGTPKAAPGYVARWIEDSLIGSESDIQSMGDRRILGAARKMIEKDDQLGLMPVRGVSLFKVEGDPEFIKPDQDLIILNRGDPRAEKGPVEVVLYVPNHAFAEGGT